MLKKKNGGCLIGYASAFRQPDEMSHTFELGISVRKDFWGVGVGRALLAAIIDSVVQMGAEKIDLVVYTNNHRAVNMYRKFGFHEEAVARRAAKTSVGFYRDCMHMALFPLEIQSVK